MNAEQKLAELANRCNEDNIISDLEGIVTCGNADDIFRAGVEHGENIVYREIVEFLKKNNEN